jgi:hypothetical protein
MGLAPTGGKDKFRLRIAITPNEFTDPNRMIARRTKGMLVLQMPFCRLGKEDLAAWTDYGNRRIVEGVGQTDVISHELD